MKFFFIGSSALYAQTLPLDTWQGPTGTDSSWFTNQNWTAPGADGGLVHLPPTATQNATVDNGTTAQVGPMPVGSSPATAATLTIGSPVAGGTVQLLAGGSLTVSNVVIGPQGTLRFSGGGTSGGVLHTNNILDNGKIVFDGSLDHSLGATVTGSGQLVMSGTGNLVLGSDNNFTGGTTINAGTLQLGNGGTTGSITGNVVDNGVLSFDRSDSVTFGGSISGTGSVTQIGSGTTILTGNNTYTGGTTIKAGTLLAGSTTGLNPNSAFVVNSTLDLNGFSNTIGSLSGNGTVLNNGSVAATLTVGNDNTSTLFSGVLENGSSTLQLIKLGSGTFVLTGNNTYTGGTTINAGTLQVGNGGTTGSITGNIIDNGILSFDRSDSVFFGGAISGKGSLLKQGAGALTLGGPGNNSYQGGTTITGGTLIAASNAAFGTGAVIADAANSPASAPSTVVINGGLTLANNFIINNGAILDNSGTIGSVSSQAGLASILNRAAGQIGTITLQSGGTIENSGLVTGGITFGTASSKLINAGTIRGTVAFGNFANSAQLFSGSAIQGDLNLGSNPGTALIFDGNGDQRLSLAVTGNVTNSGSLIKQGPGTWTVDKALAAPVSVDVVAGKLEVNSTLTSSSVTVQNGATVSGSGLITGNLTALGTISPGHSPGTLTLNGNYTQGPSGLLNIALASPTNFSRLAVGGHAALNGTLQLTLQGGFVPANGSQFTILTTGKGISGVFQNVVSPQGRAFRVSYAQAGIVQLLAGVPKPPELPIAHISDGTPSSTTEMMADLSFFSFSSLAGRMAADTEKANTISIAFDAAEFRYQGHNGEIWGFPISGQRRLTDRMRLDYQIPLQYLDYPGAHIFQSGLILELPTKIILPSENHPWTWDCKPTVMVGASGSSEVIGGGALTNVITYRWNDVVFTYANYIGFFEGDALADDDVQFRRGVDQQIMKNGLRVSIPIAKRSWLLEAYGVYTQSFQSASVPSYATIGVEIGRHFVMNVEGRAMDLGFFSLGFYSDIGNHYSSGHIKLGSGWRF